MPCCKVSAIETSQPLRVRIDRSAFALMTFGTFLTRGNVLTSVHAFTESGVGPAYLCFLAVVVWIKWPVGWLYSNPGGGWEYPLFWLVAQAVLVLCGDGAFALRSSFKS